MKISPQITPTWKQPRLADKPVSNESATEASPVDEFVLSEAANPRLMSVKPEHTEVYKSALRLCATLASLNIPCAIAGGLAVTAHGYQRSTRDVDVILTPDGLQKFKDEALGKGYLERYQGSRNLRDTISKVDVDIILSTDQPVAVPNPENSSLSNSDGLSVLSLPHLIDLKLATASLSAERSKDLKDVSGLIWTNDLNPDFAQNLAPSSREKFSELVHKETSRWAPGTLKS